MIRRLTVVSKVKPFCGAAEAKASLKRALKLAAVDANPRELHMARLKGG